MKNRKSLKMRMSIVLLIMLLASLLISQSALVFGLDCTTNPSPQYNPLSDIEWHCITNENTTCYTKVEYDGQLIQAEPYPAFDEYDNLREGFECNDLCVVKFSGKDLRNARNVTFSVVCGEDTFSQTDIRPDLGGAYSNEVTFDRAVWFKDNARYIAGIILLIVVIMFLLSIGWQALRPK